MASRKFEIRNVAYLESIFDIFSGEIWPLSNNITSTDHIIDGEANEKRKRTALDQARRVRSRIDDSQTRLITTQPNTRSTIPNYGHPPTACPMEVPNGGITAENSDAQTPNVTTNY